MENKVYDFSSAFEFLDKIGGYEEIDLSTLPVSGFSTNYQYIYYLHNTTSGLYILSLDTHTLKKGDNVFIVDTRVPDLWVREEIDQDDPFGLYSVSFAVMETTKVDLSKYATQEYVDNQIFGFSNGSRPYVLLLGKDNGPALVFGDNTFPFGTANADEVSTKRIASDQTGSIEITGKYIYSAQLNEDGSYSIINEIPIYTLQKGDVLLFPENEGVPDLYVGKTGSLDENISPFSDDDNPFGDDDFEFDFGDDDPFGDSTPTRTIHLYPIEGSQKQLIMDDARGSQITWSSNKINSELSKKADKTEVPKINDTTASATSLFSSNKVNDLLKNFVSKEARAIEGLPTETSESFYIYVTKEFTVDGVKIPIYSKGIFSALSDGFAILIDSDGYVYHCFRNVQNWICRTNKNEWVALSSMFSLELRQAFQTSWNATENYNLCYGASGAGTEASWFIQKKPDTSDVYGFISSGISNYQLRHKGGAWEVKRID